MLELINRSEAEGQGPDTSWWNSPELREPLARVIRGEDAPDDLQRCVEAAPADEQAMVRFVTRCLRALFVLQETRNKLLREARELTIHAVATNDAQAALVLADLIARHDLLEKPKTPRVAGCAIESDWALEIEADEAIAAQDVLSFDDTQALIALVAPANALLEPVFDEEQIANALARALVGEVSR